MDYIEVLLKEFGTAYEIKNNEDGDQNIRKG